MVTKAKLQMKMGTCKVSKEFMMELEDLTNKSFREKAQAGMGEALRDHLSAIQADAKAIVIG